MSALQPGGKGFAVFHPYGCKAFALKSVAPRSGLPQKQRCPRSLWEGRPRGDAGRRSAYTELCLSLGVGWKTRAAIFIDERSAAGGKASPFSTYGCKAFALKASPRGRASHKKAGSAMVPCCSSVGGAPSRRMQAAACPNPERDPLCWSGAHQALSYAFACFFCLRGPHGRGCRLFVTGCSFSM